MKKKIIIILIALAIVGLIGASIGYYMYRKPIKDFAGSKPDITMEAKDLFNDFAKDQNTANTKYVSKDKIIQISGKITEIKKNDDGTFAIILDVANPDGDISCSLTKEESPKAEKLKQGVSVTMRGQCTGYQELISKEVIMIRCGIVD